MDSSQLLARLDKAIERLEDERAFVIAHGRALNGVRSSLERLRGAVAQDHKVEEEVRDKAEKFDRLKGLFD